MAVAHFAVVSAGTNEPQLGVSVFSDEHAFNLSADDERRGQNPDAVRFFGRHQDTAELSGAQPSVGRRSGFTRKVRLAGPATGATSTSVHRDDKEQARKRHRSSAQRRAARCSPLPNPQLNEDALERTETGEGSLKHVEADEGRKEEPPFVDEVPESETREHEGASDEKDDALSSHNFDDEPSVLARPILCKNCLKLTGCCAFAAA